MQSVTSFAIPWLSMFVLAALIWLSMTAMMLTSGVPQVPAVDNASAACDAHDNWQLVYARTTGRIPASYCPER